MLSIVAIIVTPLVVGVILATTIGGWTSVIIAAVSWLVVAGLVILGASFGLRQWAPIRSLIGTAGRLADGDYRARASAGRSAPLRPVVASFNRMAERLESAEEARRRLVADVGHELRTPLTIVRGELEAMADGVHEIERDRIRRLLDDVAVMARLLDDLQTLSRAEAGTLGIHREPTDIARLVEETVGRFEADAVAAGVGLVVESFEDQRRLDGEVDPVRLQEIVANLVRNAVRATPRDGTVTVGAAPAIVDDQPGVVIEVADTGRGIPAEEIDRVFDRFHTGPESDGTGLGLTITRNLVEAHGGEIDLVSTEGLGTTVTVRLPVAP